MMRSWMLSAGACPCCSGRRAVVSWCRYDAWMIDEWDPTMGWFHYTSGTSTGRRNGTNPPLSLRRSAERKGSDGVRSRRHKEGTILREPVRGVAMGTRTWTPTPITEHRIGKGREGGASIQRTISKSINLRERFSSKSRDDVGLG